jgi:hypothetical protein
MAAMDQTKPDQWAKGTRKIKLRRMSILQENCQAHDKEGQAIKEVNENDVTRKEVSHYF